MRDCVVALIIRDRRILLGQRSPNRAFYPNVWDLFGGHVEPGERQHEALIRELGEELDIRPTAWTYLQMVAEPFPERFGAGQYHLYQVTAWEGAPTNAQPHEHVAIQWFTLAEALDVELAHPAHRQLLTRHLGSMPAC